MDWKKFFKKMLFPPVWLILVLSVLSAAGLVFVFLKGLDQSPMAYAVYVIAFYSLSVLCVFFSMVLPKQYKAIKQKIYDHPLGHRYMTDAEFKVLISLHIALIINLAFSAFKLVTGIIYSSFFIIAIAAYYILLSVARFLLLRFMRSGKQDAAAQYRRYRLTAILMMLINLTLSSFVLYMIVKNDGAPLSEIYVITSAAYTFYTLTVSVIDIIKYRKYENPILSAAKALRLAQALVSLLSLESAMLVTFGESESFRRIMLSLTGAGVCVMVLAMSVYMIVRATRQIKKLGDKEYGKQQSESAV